MRDRWVKVGIVVLVASVLGVSIQVVDHKTRAHTNQLAHELCDENQKLRAALILTLPEADAKAIDEHVPARECPQ